MHIEESKPLIPILPFLRWAGSKRRLLPHLTQLWNLEYNRYFEPFLGSGSFFFGINPQEAFLSDTNQELINAFIAIRSMPELVFDELTKYENTKETYYNLRSQKPSDMSEVASAARFIFLNRYCFNGIYRTNNSGEFNVPYSGTKTGGTPSLEKLKAVSHRLGKANIQCCDFQETIESNVSEGDFVYLDPPYIAKNVRIFNEYGPKRFIEKDFLRVASILDFIDKRDAHFVLSYVPGDIQNPHFEKWYIQYVTTNRSIASNTDHRKKVQELVVTNIPPQQFPQEELDEDCNS